MPLPSLGRMWIMSKRYPPEQRARAVKMVLDHLAEYRSVYAACQAIGPKVGVGVESLRQWTVQAQIDAQQVGRAPSRARSSVGHARGLHAGDPAGEHDRPTASPI